MQDGRNHRFRQLLVRHQPRHDRYAQGQIFGMFPVLLLHMKELSVTLIDNANIYYHNLIQKLIDTKDLVERKFSK